LDVIILSVFGLSGQTDAFSAALTIPLIIGNIAKIQIPKLLIPVFTVHGTEYDESSAWELLRNLLTTSFLFLAGICLLGTMLSGVIIPLQVPGMEPHTISLTIWLSRMLFGLVLLQGLGSIFHSVLYARHSYIVSSSGRVIVIVVTIVVVILWHDHFGVWAIASGMLLGEFVHVAVLALALSTQGFQYHWILKPTDPKLLEIFRSFRYPLVGHGLAESSIIVQDVLGSFLGSGYITLMRYSTRIVQAIAGLLLGSVMQVTLPLVSQHATDLKALRRTLLESSKLLSIIGFPVCIWLIFAAEPMVVLFFERGEFSRADATLTGTIIGLMVPYILLSRIVSLAQTPFYATMEMRPPVMSTLIFALTHIVLATLLVSLLGLFGLPIALSLAMLCSACYMIYKLQSRFGPVGWSEMRGFAFRLSATSTVAGVGFALGTSLVRMITASGWVAKLLDFSVPTFFAICAFVVSAFVFRLIDGRFLLQGGWSRSFFLGRRF
jgi:putative peptidoglycan lipid II flippase